MRIIRPNLYDYLKIIAIATMIIDHVGFFFLPLIRELRLIGRIAFPIFLFLVGFNEDYKFNRKLIFFAIILWIIENQIAILTHFEPSSLNILFSIAFARLFMSAVVKFEKYLDLIIVPILITCLILLGLSYPIFEYGTIAFLFALWGFLAKRKHKAMYLFGIITMFSHLIFSSFIFNFSTMNLLILAVFFIFEYIAFVCLSKKNSTIKISPKFDKLITLTSNKAIEVYVIHMVIFRILSIFIS